MEELPTIPAAPTTVEASPGWHAVVRWYSGDGSIEELPIVAWDLYEDGTTVPLVLDPADEAGDGRATGDMYRAVDETELIGVVGQDGRPRR